MQFVKARLQDACHSRAMCLECLSCFKRQDVFLRFLKFFTQFGTGPLSRVLWDSFAAHTHDLLSASTCEFLRACRCLCLQQPIFLPAFTALRWSNVCVRWAFLCAVYNKHESCMSIILPFLHHALREALSVLSLFNTQPVFLLLGFPLLFARSPLPVPPSSQPRQPVFYSSRLHALCRCGRLTPWVLPLSLASYNLWLLFVCSPGFSFKLIRHIIYIFTKVSTILRWGLE